MERREGWRVIVRKNRGRTRIGRWSSAVRRYKKSEWHCARRGLSKLRIASALLRTHCTPSSHLQGRTLCPRDRLQILQPQPRQPQSSRPLDPPSTPSQAPRSGPRLRARSAERLHVVQSGQYLRVPDCLALTHPQRTRGRSLSDAKFLINLGPDSSRVL